MEFSLNNRFRHFIDVTPAGATRTYARLAKGLSAYTSSENDVLDQTPYIDGEGYGSTDRVGAQYIGTGTGHRVFGNTAQDYIAASKELFGDDCKTTFKSYDPVGNLLEVNVSIVNVVDQGGEAQGKTEFSFELHGNGAPTRTPATSAPALTAVVAAGTVSGSTSFTATAGASNHLGYKLTAVALTPNAYSYAGKDIKTYTSGANIPATVGQVLNMFEIDADGSVIKFASDVLASGDIHA